MDMKLSVIIILALLFLPIYFVFAQTPAICGELEYSTLREGSFSCQKVEAEADSDAINLINEIDDSACPLGVREVMIVNKKLVPTCNNVSQVCGDSEYYEGFIEEQVQCFSISPTPHYNKSCAKNQLLRGINEYLSLDCMDISIDISCSEGQYLTGAKTHNGLYMIGESSNSLYELNIEARINEDPATIIGGFDGQERSPISITSHNGKLYMVGTGSDSLYELNIEATEDPATIIGGFSGQENDPISITSHNGKLYMIGWSSKTLYELDTTGRRTARRIGESFGGQESFPISITSHNGKLYMVGTSSNSLYELDTTGRRPATKIGKNFRDENDPGSITSHNGKLYMVGFSSNSLYELNTEATENEYPETKIGDSFGDDDDQAIGSISITSYNGKLYMIGQFSASLYELNTEARRSEDPATIVGRSFGGEGGQESLPVSITSHSRGVEAICEDF